jgi:hypothetical protein
MRIELPPSYRLVHASHRLIWDEAEKASRRRTPEDEDLVDGFPRCFMWNQPQIHEIDALRSDMALVKLVEDADAPGKMTEIVLLFSENTVHGNYDLLPKLKDDLLPETKDPAVLLYYYMLRIEAHEIQEHYKVDGKRIIDPHDPRTSFSILPVGY